MKLFSTPPVLSGKKNKKRKKLLKAQRKALKRADHPFESDKAADCRGVVLSNRAYLSVLRSRRTATGACPPCGIPCTRPAHWQRG